MDIGKKAREYEIEGEKVRLCLTAGKRKNKVEILSNEVDGKMSVYKTFSEEKDFPGIYSSVVFHKAIEIAERKDSTTEEFCIELEGFMGELYRIPELLELYKKD